MRLKNDSLTIVNSIHKYFKGNNYTDYSLSEIEQTFIELSDEIGLDILNAKIKKIAYGLVIKTNAKKNYDSWLYHKSTKPSPMTKRGRVYGAKFHKTDYNIKGYDKSLESKLHYQVKIDFDLFRFEVEVINMKNLWKRKNPIRIYTVKDLFSYEVVQYLMDDLLDKYNTIEKSPLYDFSKLNKQDRLIVSMLSFDQARGFLQKKEKHNYKRYYSRKKMINKEQNLDYAKVTELLLLNKATELLNS